MRYDKEFREQVLMELVKHNLNVSATIKEMKNQGHIVSRGTIEKWRNTEWGANYVTEMQRLIQEEAGKMKIILPPSIEKLPFQDAVSKKLVDSLDRIGQLIKQEEDLDKVTNVFKALSKVYYDSIKDTVIRDESVNVVNQIVEQQLVLVGSKRAKKEFHDKASELAPPNKL